MKRTRKLCLFVLVTSSLGLLSTTIRAGDYKRCEVTSVVFNKEKKSAVMRCFTGEVGATWVRLGIIVESMENNPTCASDISTLQATIKTLSEITGYCKRSPVVSNVTVTNVGDNLAYFYMSLKEDLVLLNVKTEGGDTLSYAELSRNTRLGGPKGALSERGEAAPNFAEYRTPGLIGDSCHHLKEKNLNYQRRLSYFQNLQTKCVAGSVDLLKEDVEELKTGTSGIQ